ncbi:type II toxin-antitoxin system RelE/ParE family toxin [Nitrosomonas halophila]|nr:type II toxin-antitoxin system RelE/ParE family toxin [Nitrosomonas halophila]
MNKRLHFSIMLIIKQLPQFKAWLFGLKNGMTRRRLARRLEKAQNGNLGDIKPVGNGVFEMREHFGPGWRMYYIQRGELLIVMLGGGDKSSQNEDIAKAQSIAASLED